MKKILGASFALALLFVCFASIATATTLTFNSHPSSLNTAFDNITSSSGPVFGIPKNPAWYGPISGTAWASPFQSGDPSAVGYVVVPNGTYTFTHTFVLPANFVVTSASLEFLADDTATGTLNGNILFSPTLTPGIYCVTAPGPGCVQATEFNAALSIADFVAGSNVLSFPTQQLFGSSFGADWQLTINGTTTPEPTTFILMGAGLGLVGLLRRRRGVKS